MQFWSQGKNSLYQMSFKFGSEESWALYNVEQYIVMEFVAVLSGLFQ